LATSLTLLTGHLSSWQQQQQKEQQQEQEQEQQQLPGVYPDEQVQYVLMQQGSHVNASAPAERMQS
jgi:hypothetical protein